MLIKSSWMEAVTLLLVISLVSGLSAFLWPFAVVRADSQDELIGPAEAVLALPNGNLVLLICSI